MTETQKEQRAHARARSNGVCYVCGQTLGSGAQYAHRIANTQQNRIKYGSFIIDHTLNGEMVCSLACNSNMNIANRPNECLDLIQRIIDFEKAKRGFKNG